MRVYRIVRGTVLPGALYEVRSVEVAPTKHGYISKCNRQIPALDKPDIKLRVIVYSQSDDTSKLERLCAKIRQAIDEYNGG